MPKPTHPDRYAQFIPKLNGNEFDMINRFDGYKDFNSDKKIKMYHITYYEKTKKISYKIELVPKIDAERKHMQGTYLYVDKEMNTKEENEILEKFLKKQSKTRSDRSNNKQQVKKIATGESRIKQKKIQFYDSKIKKRIKNTVNKNSITKKKENKQQGIGKN